MYKCWNCGTEHEIPASNDAYNRGYSDGYKEAKRTLLTPMQAEQFDAMIEALEGKSSNGHLPECAVPWIRECICKELKMAYERGNKDASPYMDWEYDE